MAFLRATAECFARLSYGLSVCLSVRHTSAAVCQAKVTKSSLWDATMTLVFCDKISCRCVRSFPPNGNTKEGYSPKMSLFYRCWLI